MPIRINLLKEIQEEEELRRRDPVKRALFLGAFLVVLSLAWFSVVWLGTKTAESLKSQVDRDIQTQTNDFNQVQIDLKKIADGQKRLGALTQLTTNRFLQGNLLNALQQVYVPNVQLTRIRIEQNYTLKDGTPPKTNSYGVVAGQPPTSTERITMMLDAKDSSPSPGDQVNHYKDALAALDYFKSSLNKTNGLRLLNLSAPQTTLNGKSFVLFTLECRFSEKTLSEKAR